MVTMKKYTNPNITINEDNQIVSISNGFTLKSINGLSDCEQKLRVSNIGTRLQVYSTGNCHDIQIPQASEFITGLMTRKHVNNLNSKLNNHLADKCVFVGFSDNMVRETSVSGDLYIDDNYQFILKNRDSIVPGIYKNPIIEIDRRGQVTDIKSSKDTMTSLNNITAPNQFIKLETSEPFSLVTKNNTHTINIPIVGKQTTSPFGMISRNDYNEFNSKQESILSKGHLWIGSNNNKPREFKPQGDITIDSGDNFQLTTIQDLEPGVYLSPKITIDSKGRIVKIHQNYIPHFDTLNGCIQPKQFLKTGHSGNDFTITSEEGIHTFNIPYVSQNSNGLLKSETWNTLMDRINTIERMVLNIQKQIISNK